MEEASWRRHHGGGILGKASWRRHLVGGILEEASWSRHHGGGIMASRDIWETAERQLGGIWEASGRHLGTSGSHLGGIWELGWPWESSGRVWRHLGGPGLQKVEHLSAKIDL